MAGKKTLKGDYKKKQEKKDKSQPTTYTLTELAIASLTGCLNSTIFDPSSLLPVCEDGRTDLRLQPSAH